MKYLVPASTSESSHLELSVMESRCTKVICMNRLNIEDVTCKLGIFEIWIFQQILGKQYPFNHVNFTIYVQKQL